MPTGTGCLSGRGSPFSDRFSPLCPVPPDASLIRSRPVNKRLSSFSLPENWTFLLLLAAAAGVRIYGAWFYRHTVNVDAAVVAMMARDIAEGTHFPTFFYGQPHMGSLEAFVSAGFCRILGVSGFAVNLGTALVSLGLIPVVYVWARQAADRKAATLATACCVIGPLGFFHYNASPRGGYAATLVFGGFVLMYATRMVLKWKRDQAQSHADFAWLGLLAGLGWWSSQLTTAALGAAALLLLLAMGRRAFSLRIGTGLAAFLAGSFPLWLYNFRNDWATFNFADSLGSHSIGEGLERLYFSRMEMLFVAGQLPVAVRPVLAAVLLGLVAAGGWLWLRSMWKRNTSTFWTFTGLLLFMGVFSVLFTQSHLSIQPTPRYLLPLVGPFAVWCGIVLAQTPRGPVLRGLRLLSVVVLLSLPSLFLFDRSFLHWSEDRTREAQVLAEKIRPLELEAVYTPLHYRFWNFILEEPPVFVDLQKEVFPGHAATAESTSQIGVLDDYAGLQGFLTRSGVRASTHPLGAHSVTHSFSQAARSVPLPSEQITRLIGPGGGRDPEALTSGDLSRTVSFPASAEWQDLVVELKGPTELSGIRLWPAREDLLPHWIAVEGRSGDGDWFQLSPATPVSFYFWSHDRIYWAEPYFRIQVGFDPQPLTAVRIRLRQDSPESRSGLVHLDLLQPFTPDQEPDPQALLTLLQKEQITGVVADRGESAWIARASGDQIRTVRPQRTHPESLPVPYPDLVLPAGSAWVVREEEAGPVSSWLETTPHTLTRAEVPGFVIWMADTEHRFEGKVWTGCSLHTHPARMAQVLWEEGSHEAAAALHPWLAPPPEPQIPLEIRFANGVECVGVSLSAESGRPGEVLELTTHWRLPEGTDADIRNLSMFAHWVNGPARIITDQALLEEVPEPHLEIMPEHRTYTMTRSFQIPEVHQESYPLRLGLYHPLSGHRFRPRTRLPSRDGYVEIPLKITVNPSRPELSVQ